ncbi:F0F1 ATP synthase subunit delta [Otariodibacter sp.]|uniref:F0F1 ATP synthase subunit delta n=1 Tax=Otariodibacter sp. TaxID=3030919 RepID=UPI0026076D0D|nr:F0F1 ATP synthase subunit delta [Otariodibacter sp.]
MSELTTIARPYAKAVFDFALEQSQLDKWQEMLQFSALVAENEEVVAFINSSLSSTQIADIFIAICAEQLDQYGQNFIRIMAENKRLIALPSVLNAFLELRSEHDSTKNVEVVSATKLSKAQTTKIVTAMEKRLNCKVSLVSHVDKSLLAGIIIRYDDTVIDASSRGQLNRLATELCL